ncbi:MAG: sialidase family protein [Anaerolineaceae bacterium]
MPNGELIAAWFAGDEEGSKNSVILLSRKRDNYSEWSSPQVVVDVYEHASGNPRLFMGPDQALWLLAPINYGEWCQGGTRLFLKRSNDFGITWFDLELFINEQGVLGKNKPLVTKDGTYIIPCEYERYWKVVFIRSTDNGKSWALVECPENSARLHQPTLYQKEDGKIIAFMRTWEGVIYQTYSMNDGATWSCPAPTRIPNNNSGIDLVKLLDGRVALVCNPCSLGPKGDLIIKPEDRPAFIDATALCQADTYQINNILDPTRVSDRPISGYPMWGPRSPLSLLISEAEENSWRYIADIEKGFGEFSYPAVIQSEPNQVLIAYTANRREIRYVQYELSNYFNGKLFFS